jgi:SAM-dependent methyltransferase
VNATSPRFWPLFFEVFESLPRQGPGNRASALRALELCGHLPAAPRVLDLGCGSGTQTLLLAELLGEATIVAVDNHPPFVERLRREAWERGLAQRVQPLLGDIAALDLPPESFDLIWSEGALYNVGIENALRTCRTLLRPGGCLAFTDAVWRVENPPAEIEESFDFDYPAMGPVPAVLTTIARSGLDLLGHFPLPDEAWWTDFYTPMERAIERLRHRYASDPEALAVLSQIAREPELHRLYSHTYAYEFFVARRRG